MWGEGESRERSFNGEIFLQIKMSNEDMGIETNWIYFIITLTSAVAEDVAMHWTGSELKLLWIPNKHNLFTQTQC